ncbi:MAG: hypothetical protein H6842_03715 [Rhodospirillaceae bacterium]|nr:hypothetical protein [Rhodospirillaceae bacterium]
MQVPVDAHDLLKALAQRLRAGEDPTAALFDLVAQQSAPLTGCRPIGALRRGRRWYGRS